MKLDHVLLVPVLLLGLAGCTVNNYYGSAPHAPHDETSKPDLSERLALIDQLQGVHTAAKATMDNIHYAGTNGYHPQRADFIDGETQPIIWIEPSSGELIHSDSELDIAISGDGFLEIEHPWDEPGDVVYTRDGRLAINSDGELVWGEKDGPRLTDGIVVTPAAIAVQIARDGIVYEILEDGSKTAVGQITLHRFEHQRGIRAIGNRWYAVADPHAVRISATPGTEWLGTLVQGRLEQCTVDVEREFAEFVQLAKWQNELVEALDLSHADQYRLSHLPVSPDFFEKLAAEAR